MFKTVSLIFLFRGHAELKNDKIKHALKVTLCI